MVEQRVEPWQEQEAAADFTPGTKRRRNRQIGVRAMVFSLAVIAIAQAVTFTEDTQIGSDNSTYDGSDVIIDGCTLTIDGAHSFSNFDIISGGSVTHSLGAGLELPIAGDMAIADGTSINFDGYGSESGPGAGVRSQNGGGAGHGGSGGDRWSAGDVTYGFAAEPITFGNGGGRGWHTSPMKVPGGRRGGQLPCRRTGRCAFSSQDRTDRGPANLCLHPI